GTAFLRKTHDSPLSCFQSMRYRQVMTTPVNVGVLQLSMEPAHETIEMAKTCEHAGFDAFWIAEAYPWWRKHGFEARSSTAILVVIASQTRRIQLGWG